MLRFSALLTTLYILLVFPVTSLATEDPIVTIKVDGEFHDVSQNIRMAITGKGINIAHILPASDMLSRTGRDYGYQNNTYADARIYEFCSAAISHKLSRHHPDNIVLCPFTISVYSLVKEPGKVYLSYRKPTGRPGSEEIVNEVIELITSIIEDATW